MSTLLGLTIISALITFMLFIPFIDFLYKVKLRRLHQKTKDMFNVRTPIFDKFHDWKAGTPIGGGILIIAVVCLLTLWAYGLLEVELNVWQVIVLLFSFVSFGVLGLFDDVRKIAPSKNDMFFGLRFRHKFLIQLALAFIIGTIFYFQLGYSFIHFAGLGTIEIGFLFIPFAAFVIVAFVNAVNITDGLDGLASGLLLICLIAFLAISAQSLDQSLGIFIAVLLGSIGAFLYFNIYKARLWLGDVGALSLGAALAVIGLLSGKALTLAVIGGFFVLEVTSSLIQILSKKYLGKRIFPAAPFHLYLQKRGWSEPKIVMRAWLIGFFFAAVGLYLAFIS